MQPEPFWTVLIVSARGRATRRLRIPARAVRAARVLALALVCSSAFAGWQLQALLGLDGPRVTQLGVLPWSTARGSLFMSLAPSRPTVSRVEQRRRAVRERAERLGLGDRRAASSLLLGIVEPGWLAEAERSGSSDGTLRWPIDEGWFGRGFGSGAGGYHLAVDINAPIGTDVLAAAAGIVGYSGHELRGFGNVVLIVHPGGWVTLYGHNQRNLVVAGQRVAQGETIAALGSTGRSMGPHVHFEFMHAGANCDPMPLIAAGPQSYRNYMPSAPPLAWHSGTPRPSAIRCHRRMAHPVHAEEGGDAPEELFAPPLAAADLGRSP